MLRGEALEKWVDGGQQQWFWGEGGRSGGWGIIIGVGISAKLGGGWMGRHGKMQTGHGKVDCNVEQGKDCYWRISMLA